MKPNESPTLPAPRPRAAIRAFLLDDHPLIRNGLKAIIDAEGDMEVVGEADEAQQALAGIADTRPDLAVVDISLKGMDGLEFIKHAKARFGDLRVLVVSMHDEALYAERAMRAGAGGYLMKQEASEKVVLAMRRILRGEPFLSDRMVSQVLKRVSGGGQSSFFDGLTDRELEIFHHMGRGLRIREIAESLSLSAKTVESHCTNLRKKLGSKGVVDLMHFAIRWAHANGG